LLHQNENPEKRNHEARTAQGPQGWFRVEQFEGGGRGPRERGPLPEAANSSTPATLASQSRAGRWFLLFSGFSFFEKAGKRERGPLARETATKPTLSRDRRHSEHRKAAAESR
jgi:hypothetical protein